MKFNGKSLQALATQKVVLPRPEGQDDIILLVRASMPSEASSARLMFPDPEPPKDFVYKNGKSGTPLRDPDTDKPLMEYNVDDPQYMRDQAHAMRMRSMATFLNAIDKDEAISFETKEKPQTQAWYEAASKEVEAAGISAGDMSLVLDVSARLSNVDSGATERAAEAFSKRFLPKNAD